MKGIKDNNPSDGFDETLGTALSRHLSRLDTGGCPEPGALAALVEGNLPEDEKDRLMKHVASCDTCYDTFILTGELQRDTAGGSEKDENNENLQQLTENSPTKTAAKKNGNRMLRSYLPLAACILIAVVSIYVFYHGEMPVGAPGTMKKEAFRMEEQEMRMDSRERLKQPKQSQRQLQEQIVALEKKKQDVYAQKETEEKTARLKGLSEDMEKKRSVESQGKVKRMSAVIPKKAERQVQNKPATETVTRDEATRQRAKEKAPRRKPEADSLKDRKTTAMPRVGAGKKSKTKKNDAFYARAQKQQSAAPPAVAKAAPSPNEANAHTTGGASKQDKNAPLKKSQIKKQDSKAKGKPEVRQSPTIKIIPVPVQQGVDRLNRQAANFNKYIPSGELADIFSETILLADNMQKNFREPGHLEKAAEPEPVDPRSNYYEVESSNTETDVTGMNYAGQVSSFLNVESNEQGVAVYPHINWFLSKSTPGSAERKFFTLARLGWCVDGVCHGGIGSAPVWDTGNKVDVKSLSAQWKTLAPQLTGIFKRIAQETAAHLEKVVAK
ncbi:MAG: hypothetical protein GY765_41830 [bacterium]|nr:hypothetical protein [bacterium]